MAIPGPILDTSGGIMVVNYTNGQRTHRTRVHINAFNSATGAYLVSTGGLEVNVSNTFTALAGFLAAFYTNVWTFSLGAVYQQSGGVISQVFPVINPTAVVGTNGGSLSALSEAFYCFNFRSTTGRRAKIFLIEPATFTLTTAFTQIGNAAGNLNAKLVAYLATVPPTQVVARDSSSLLNAAHVTQGFNKKLRRRAGNA